MSFEMQFSSIFAFGILAYLAFLVSSQGNTNYCYKCEYETVCSDSDKPPCENAGICSFTEINHCQSHLQIDRVGCTKPGRFPIPGELVKYLDCRYGLVGTIKTCPRGLVFHHSSRKCTPPMTGIIQSQWKDVSQFNCLERGLFRDPNNCRVYYYCLYADSVPIKYVCPLHMCFYEDRGVCVHVWEIERKMREELESIGNRHIMYEEEAAEYKTNDRLKRNGPTQAAALDQEQFRFMDYENPITTRSHESDRDDYDEPIPPFITTSTPHPKTTTRKTTTTPKTTTTTKKTTTTPKTTTTTKRTTTTPKTTTTTERTTTTTPTTTTTKRTTTTRRTTTTTTTKAPPRKKCLIPGLYPDLEDCHKYWICRPIHNNFINGLEYVQKSCGEKYWAPLLFSCVSFVPLGCYFYGKMYIPNQRNLLIHDSSVNSKYNRVNEDALHDTIHYYHRDRKIH